jgi:hypothetical protein
LVKFLKFPQNSANDILKSRTCREAIMTQLKYLSHLSLALFIVLVAAISPLKLMAQDDSDEDTFVPPSSSSSSAAPPVIMDESDSNSVNDVEEYDG